MQTLPYMVFIIFILLIFFGISISCVVIWFKSFKKTKEILRDPNQHWSIKLAIYYGIYFTIFLLLSVFVSLILSLALFMQRSFYL